MKMRQLNVGCFGGGTGLPSLLGGLKNNPWLRLNAVVTMFDSGGSSGQLRDELGVLPPGDVLKCALALARNEAEARRVLLSRVPSIDPAPAMERPPTRADVADAAARRSHWRQSAAVDDGAVQRRFSCRRSTDCDRCSAAPATSGRSASSARACAPNTATACTTRGEVEVDRGQSSGQFVKRIWLEPAAQIHPAVARAIRTFDAVLIGPGSFYTSLMPIFLVEGVRDALQDVRGPVILISNLLTEGSGMNGFTAGDGVRQISDAIGRPVDVVIHNATGPSDDVLARYAAEEKRPLELGEPSRRHRADRRRFLAGRDCATWTQKARSGGVARSGEETL